MGQLFIHLVVFWWVVFWSAGGLSSVCTQQCSCMHACMPRWLVDYNANSSVKLASTGSHAQPAVLHNWRLTLHFLCVLTPFPTELWMSLLTSITLVPGSTCMHVKSRYNNYNIRQQPYQCAWSLLQPVQCQTGVDFCFETNSGHSPACSGRAICLCHSAWYNYGPCMSGMPCVHNYVYI